MIDTLTIFENIALALSINGVKEKEIKERVISISKKLQIDSVLQNIRMKFLEDKNKDVHVLEQLSMNLY